VKRSAVIFNHFIEHSRMQQDESAVQEKSREALFKKLVGHGVHDGEFAKIQLA
jgi:hypothetical protein